MEFERIRREKLEVQLDHTRQELEKSIKSLRDYETKVGVLQFSLGIKALKHNIICIPIPIKGCSTRTLYTTH